jgi:hypothetical protein
MNVCGLVSVSSGKGNAAPKKWDAHGWRKSPSEDLAVIVIAFLCGIYAVLERF